MILLNFGQAGLITVTLNEKRTLDAGYYLFRFTHILTKNVVTKIYNFSEDISPSQERYNEFDITTDTVFSGSPIGQWIYKVYEQASSTNTEEGDSLVERGIMMLRPVTDFEFESYNEPTTYKAYGG